VDEKTVREARKAISENSEIKQPPRMRSNGRPYPATTKPKLKVVPRDEEIPTLEEDARSSRAL
jgi:hypothetical protein